jgi:hypothetical protein
MGVLLHWHEEAELGLAEAFSAGHYDGRHLARQRPARRHCDA